MSQTDQGTQPDWGVTARSMASTIEAASRGKGGFGLGEVAVLRRMDVDRPPSDFWRMFGGHLTFVPDAFVRRWALAAKGMAILGRNCQDASIAPGNALASAGYSKSSPIRLDRLCSSDGEVFEDLLIGACRHLAQQAQPLDWGRFIRFVVLTGRDDRSEETRKIMRDFHSPRRKAETAN